MSLITNTYLSFNKKVNLLRNKKLGSNSKVKGSRAKKQRNERSVWTGLSESRQRIRLESKIRYILL